MASDVKYDELLIGLALNGGPLHDYVEKGTLSSKHFDSPVPKLLFKTILKYYEKRAKFPTARIVEDLFVDGKHKDAAAVVAYAKKASRTASETQVQRGEIEHYVERLKEIHADYSFKNNLERTIMLLKSEGAQAAREFFQSAIEEDVEHEDNVRTVDLIEDFGEFEEDVKRRRESPEDSGAIPIGIEPFDRALGGGLLPGELLLIGAVPSGGKSTGLLDGLISTAEKGHKGHFFTIEMSVNQTAFRGYSRACGVSTRKFRNAEFISDDELEEWKRAIEKLKEVEGAGVKVTGIPDHASTRYMRAESARLKRKDGFEPDIIFVDYAGIMRPADNNQYKHESDWAYIGQNVRDLKNWALADNKPIVSAIQLLPDAIGKDSLTYKDIGLSKLLISAHADAIFAIIPLETDEHEFIDHMRVQVLKAREGTETADGHKITFIDLHPDFRKMRIDKGRS